LGEGLFILLQRLPNFEIDFLGRSKKRLLLTQLFMAIGLIIFLAWGYLFRAGYYLPEGVGLVGDNHLFVHHALEPGLYYYYGHFLFPIILEPIIQLGLHTHLLDALDPFLNAKVMALSSLPTRVLALSSLLLLGWYIYRKYRSFFLGILAIFTFAWSYGFWIYCLQGNGLGLVLPIEIMAIISILMWIDSQNDKWLFSAGLAISAAVFAHIAAFIFSLSVFITVVLLVFSQRMNAMKKIKAVIWFSIPIISLGVIFYLLIANKVGTMRPIAIFHRIAQDPTGDMGNQMVSLGNPVGTFLLKMAHNGFTSVIQSFNRWEIKYSFEFFIVFIMGSSLVALLLSFLKNVKLSIKELLMSPP